MTRTRPLLSLADDFLYPYLLPSHSKRWWGWGGGWGVSLLFLLYPGEQAQGWEGISYLNLHKCGVRRVEGLERLKGLKTLVLSFEISRVEGIAELPQLRTLDLSHNQIRKVEGLKGMTALLHLDLSRNLIAKLEEVYAIKKHTPQLTLLDLSSNPVCDDKSYRPTVLRKMKSLTSFDGLEITAEDKSTFADTAGGLALSLVLDGMTEGTRWSSSTLPVNPPAISTSSVDGSGGGDSSIQLNQITELSLERKDIRRLQNMTALSALRSVSFLDNQISHIEGLDGCTSLEEISFEDNRLAQIEGLKGLSWLNLSRNKITALDLMSCVTNLVHLSIEDNELSSLQGIEPLMSLMELYAANNRILELREVQRLRDMPKLIILDLSGNPCGASQATINAAGGGGAVLPSEEYRLYVIYNVRKLKVLDGVPIEAAEQAAAKSKYSGRMTREFLEERIRGQKGGGGESSMAVRDLDCSNIKIRDVGSVFLQGGEELQECLQELCLDSNSLVEISGMALLQQLVVLKLNNNRLGEECTFLLQSMVDKNADLSRSIAARALQASSSDPPSILPILFPNIQVLQLGGNQIASISSLHLSSLSTLHSLFLQNNDITRIEGLAGLSNLQELVLDRNRIRYVDPEAFYGLPRLRELRIEENGLRSLANLGQLASLQALHLSQNRIADLGDLDKQEGLVNLVEVSLTNNPVTRKQAYRRRRNITPSASIGYK